MNAPQALEQAIHAFTGGALDRAETLCRIALQHDPRSAEALHLLGVISGQLNRVDEAAALLAQSVELEPDNPFSRCDFGTLLRLQGRPAEALEQFERAIALQPQNAAALNDRGLALHALQRFAEAADSYGEAVALAPDFAEAHYNRGLALGELGRRQEALQCFDRVIALDPRHAEAHLLRGNLLVETGNPDAALKAFDRAIAVKPEFAEAHNNRGNILHAMRRPQDALASYDQAIKLRPDFDEALNNRGAALRDLGRLAEALQSIDRALAVRPDNAHAQNNRGAVLYGLNRFAESVASCERAVALLPAYAEAHNNRGLACVRLRRYAEAVDSFRRAVALDPTIELLAGNLLMAQMHLCQWEDFDAGVRDLEQRIARGENATPPYVVLALTDSPALQRRAAENHVPRTFPSNPVLGAFGKRARAEKIRVGYFSADFRTHPSSVLTADLFETHDRSRFEFTGFYFGPDVHDGMRRRISAALDRFIDVGAKSDQEIAQLARELQIDIAVDLMGFTEHSRTGIMACRAAPVQVSYLGYPGTMGAAYIDYIVADEVLIPDESRKHYAEKIVFLPHSFQPNDRKREISARAFTRGELGLPSSGVVFCAFHNSYKIMPAMFGRWMSILKNVAGSVLWLREDTAEVAASLRREAERNGVDGQRLIFAPRIDFADHLARHRQADLFLDAFPFNAHTTASDALWAGLPVLTCAGDAYISRVAASLLKAVGLPELVTRSQEDYEALALDLARSPDTLARFRRKLMDNRHTSPLFDTPRYARHLEAAYARMYELQQAGLAPEHIDIAA
jgi:predicted O-linked N-acetylglucosamine transferase (SPINDLY family)